MAAMDNPMDPFASQEDARPPPSVAAEAAAAATASAAAAASSLGVSLGLEDPDLSEGKPAGIGITAMQAALGRGSKRPKITHSLFFEDDRGLKKILRTFPDIKVHGKGKEYEDLTLLLRHYKKWFQELYPYGDHFEDLVWKARSVLEDKEKEDDGTLSDPRERLHAFRFQYKNIPPEQDRSSAPTAGAQLSDEVQAKIKASREQALERKRQREAQNNPTPASQKGASQELDMEELWRIEEERAAAASRPSQGAAPPGFDDDEDDPFGFGGGFDADFGGSAPAATNTQKSTKAPPRPSFDDEEDDPFGFGGGFDEDFGGPAPAAPKPQTASAPGAAPEVQASDEVQAKIKASREQAVERKRQREVAKALESKAAEAAAVPNAGAANGAASADKIAAAAVALGLVPGAFDDEDDPFAGQDDFDDDPFAGHNPFDEP